LYCSKYSFISDIGKSSIHWFVVVPVLLKGDAGYLLPPSVLAKGEAGTLCFFRDGGTP